MNLVESAGLLVSLSTLYLGLWTVANSNDRTVDIEMAQYLLTFTVLLVNIGWASFILYHLYHGYHVGDMLLRLYAAEGDARPKETHTFSKLFSVELSELQSIPSKYYDDNGDVKVMNPLSDATTPSVMEKPSYRNSGNRLK